SRSLSRARTGEPVSCPSSRLAVASRPPRLTPWDYPEPPPTNGGLGRIPAGEESGVKIAPGTASVRARPPAANVLAAIGDTQLVEMTRLLERRDVRAWAKLESL